MPPELEGDHFEEQVDAAQEREASNQREHDHWNQIAFVESSMNQKKIINVSFNDFNQSINQELQEGAHESHEGVIGQPPTEKREAVRSTEQIISNRQSNKNLNNFLEALQKIKP